MPDTEAKRRFLKYLASASGVNEPVECIETHMSWVFLHGDIAYKLKKPVRLPYLDFTTLAARGYYCREEVRLNARLAPGVYLGVVALQCNGNMLYLVADCKSAVAEETVDWIVLMRRLPAHRMLSQQLARHCVLAQDIHGLGALLADFYCHALPVALATADYKQRFVDKQLSNRELLLQQGFMLQDAGLAIAGLDSALLRALPLLSERCTSGRIIDGHGDLRPDHVCLLQPPLVIDCLEFSPVLRAVDPWDEIAFLGMECAQAGAPWIGVLLQEALQAALRERPPAALLHFYAAHHALLRARLAVAHLLDPSPRTPEKWLPAARRYLSCALLELARFDAADGA